MDISEEEAPFTKLTFKLGVRGNFTCASSNILYLCCYIIYLLHVIFFTCATCDILYLFPNRVKNSIASFVVCASGSSSKEFFIDKMIISENISEFKNDKIIVSENISGFKVKPAIWPMYTI